MRHGEYGYTVYAMPDGQRIGSTRTAANAALLVALATDAGWIEYQTEDGRTSIAVYNSETDETESGASYLEIGDTLISRAIAIERMQRHVTDLGWWRIPTHINGDS